MVWLLKGFMLQVRFISLMLQVPALHSRNTTQRPPAGRRHFANYFLSQSPFQKSNQNAVIMQIQLNKNKTKQFPEKVPDPRTPKIPPQTAASKPVCISSKKRSKIKEKHVISKTNHVN